MREKEITTSALEEALFNREMENIEAQLTQLRKKLHEIFAPYQIDSGSEPVAVEQSMTGLLRGSNSYFAGYTARAAISPATDLHPAIKRAILKTAIEKHLAVVDELAEVRQAVDSIQNQG